ncbi:uncharacterized protein LOC111619203 isoform X1 [Centruroides sculpturatus]|uniref:uncharacterized protein LOC111619203 isoform X1 n=2 Tax=Centruroides sculpturatus TaxID=218467 RepID=UPI000C6DDA38|nr:uncharacterized protein LOC111619203 isoform X1 [Centruroides sculpturatus]
MVFVNRSEQYRLYTGGNIVSLCACCGRQAWSDYYGNFACRICIRFLIKCIRERKTCECQRRADLCQITTDSQSKCDFCHLQRLYNAGIRPKMYGRHENGWYMKDVAPKLVRVRAQNYCECPYCEAENDMMKAFKFGCNLYFISWWITNLPNIRLGDLPYVNSRNMSFRGTILGAVLNSVHAHDVLKCGYRYFDPYKCRVLEHQNFSFLCLSVTRRFLRDSELGIPTLQQEAAYIIRNILPYSR